MRIGTWNLAGRWDQRHFMLLEGAACDLWLLTEVNDWLALPGYHEVRTQASMAPKRRWAGVFSRQQLRALPDPHPATAAITVGELTVWSSVLPWRSCGGAPTWTGDRHVDKTQAVLDALIGEQPPSDPVWGGDWNHALSGQEYVGSIGGRDAVLAAVATAGLQVPTSELSHRVPGLLSIDHIAVPNNWDVEHAARTVAETDGERLSDHDSYVIQTN
jgi:hypothetical protein